MSQSTPKCLISCQGRSLLQRHIGILNHCGIAEIALVVGYLSGMIEAELARIGRPQITLIENPEYRLGSVFSLWCARHYITENDDVLLMDADVLYDHRLLKRLIDSAHRNCCLLDRNFKPGEEPVKLCIRQGRIVEFGKQIEGPYDLVGESVGFFCMDSQKAASLMDAAAYHVANGKSDAPYEEVLRDVLLAGAGDFGYEDITGLPWIEMDFPEDLVLARTVVEPQLLPLPR